MFMTLQPASICCFLLVLSLLNSGLPRALDAQNTNKTAITNVSVIDVVSGNVLEGQTIVLSGDQIEVVADEGETAIPANAKRIDGTGKFAIPGLWDMHVHPYSQDSLGLFPINGVVGVRVMFGQPAHHQWRKQIEMGDQLGPRMIIASAIIDGPNPIFPGSLVAMDADSGRQAIESAVKKNADFAKILPLLPRDAYFSIADACRKINLPFDGHVPRMVTPKEASDAGQRSMEHMDEIILACSRESDQLRKLLSEYVEEQDGSVRALYGGGGAPSIMKRAVDSFDEKKADELLKTLKKNNTWQCPTLTVLRNLAYLTEPEIQNNPNVRYVPTNIRPMVTPKHPRSQKTSDEIKFERETLALNYKILARMHGAGVPILAGTDVSNPFCLPGFSLHDELELLVKSGLKPIDALRSATINPARFQNREQTMGSIEPGKVADIVLLNANPLDEISNTTKIETVVVQGKTFQRPQLDQLLDEFDTSRFRAFKNKEFWRLANIDGETPLEIFCKAAYLNVCNRPAESNQLLDAISPDGKAVPQSFAFEFWQLRNDNYVKLFDYQHAYETSVQINSRFKSRLGDDLEDSLNAQRIWKSLRQAQPQVVEEFKPATVTTETDAASLITVRVQSNDIVTNFVFDTGAGISSITESLAEKLDLELMPNENTTVKGFTGVANPVRMAVCKQLMIGSIVVRNAPFLVFDDAALTFASGAYKINGIIGFPIAKELGTIKISSGRLDISKGLELPNPVEKNLFIDLLHPVLALRYGGQTLPFNLDTGAQASVFNRLFYETFGDSLKSEGTIEKRKQASAGGEREFQALVLKRLGAKLGNQDVQFPAVEIDIDNYHISKKLYGNIGQDLLKQYDNATISFEHNCLILTND